MRIYSPFLTDARLRGRPSRRRGFRLLSTFLFHSSSIASRYSEEFLSTKDREPVFYVGGDLQLEGRMAGRRRSGEPQPCERDSDGLTGQYFCVEHTKIGSDRAAGDLHKWNSAYIRGKGYPEGICELETPAVYHWCTGYLSAGKLRAGNFFSVFRHL